jgi:hypothetical protein
MKRDMDLIRELLLAIEADPRLDGLRVAHFAGPEIWAKTNGGAKRAGSFSLNLLGDLATGFVKTKIEHHTGIKL